MKWGGGSQSSNRHSDCVRKCNRKLLFCEMLFLSGGGWTPEPIKCCHSCHKTCNIPHRAGSNGSLAILGISPCNHRFSKAGSSAAQGCNLFKPTVVSFNNLIWFFSWHSLCPDNFTMLVALLCLIIL